MRLLPILPEELLIEILVRLPVKSLLRCKAVCKSWRSLICSSSFIEEHFDKASEPDRRRLAIFLNSSLADNCLWLTLKIVNYNVVSFPIEKTIRHLVHKTHGGYLDRLYLSYCRGLFMIGTFEQGLDWFLWNPSTGEHKYIPQSPSLRNHAKLAAALGYDFSTKSHKVVVVGTSGTRYLIEVYDLKTSSWTRIDGGEIKYTHSAWSGTVTLFNGSPCWIRAELHDDVFVHRILYYDFGVNKLMEVAQPKGCKRNRWLLNTEGCLAVYHLELDRYEIWVMKEFGVEESWTKLASIPSFAHPPPTTIISAKNGEVLASAENRILLRDSRFLVHKLTEENPNIEIPGDWSTSEGVGVSYVESLVSLAKCPRIPKEIIPNCRPMTPHLPKMPPKMYS